MEIKTGIDITFVPKFEKILQRSGQSFLDHVFHPEEQSPTTPSHLAGIFAAKEATIKALNLPKDCWLKMKVRKDKSGRPIIELMPELKHNFQILSSDVSISHDQDYAIAVAVFMIKG